MSPSSSRCLECCSRVSTCFEPRSDGSTKACQEATKGLQGPPRRGEDFVYRLQVSLEELYRGSMRKLLVERQVK